MGIKLEKNKVRININGISCNILSDESESYVHSVADEVNDAIQKVKLSNPGLSQSIVNILVMLDFCDRAKKSEYKLENLKTQPSNNMSDFGNSDDLKPKLKSSGQKLNSELNKAGNKAKKSKSNNNKS